MNTKAHYLAIILLILVMFSLNAVVANENITLDDGNDIVSTTPDSIQTPDSEDLDEKCLSATGNSAGENLSSNNDDDMLKTSEDSILTATVDGNTFADIQEAIDNSGSGATIFLNGKYYNGNDMRITINKDIVIDGSSSSDRNLVSTLDANNFRRIMYSTGAYNVTLRNLVLKNGPL